ncbi:methyltransferase [Actinosynnema sp. NPDC020468]|uniref:methyltransferase n=1 Tax=Actinosynnema sp. NPDC020468 TaxID=3154488 RepID=UPI0033F6A6F0
MSVDSTAPPEPGVVAALARLGDYVTPLALRVAVSIGVPDALAGGPLGAEQIADRVGAHPPSLLRVLRALSGSGVFHERERGVFALTPISELLRSDHPHTVRGMYQMSDVDVRAWSAFEVSVRTPGSGFEHVHGQDFWEYVATHEDYRAVHERDMWDMTERELEVVGFAYDLGGVRRLVDVGGGNGQFLAGLLTANPGMSGVLFDRPHVAPGAVPWLTESGVLDRCEVVGGDFFDSVPSGGDAYLLKRVFYDFSDEQVVRILSNVRSAMDPAGRVLVLDGVVRADNRWDPGKIHDLYVLGMGQGRCRTRAEMGALFAAAGLRLTRVAPTGIFPLVEGRLA